ncbi:porin [Anaerosinus gibii]|uniref:Porin n=1 Tax=Selenobaculum gibii TaxID=3054208 RepID=A0A9Y2AH73_9FIRM|nr:porin [Selenobaculum gbiensis]WIW70019.1 porin [Selenobaculum gbiensis]
MKKIMSMMVAGVIMTTIPVYAAPLEVTGDASIKYQRDTAEGEDTISGTITSIKLMGEIELGSNWSLYGRLGAQTTTNPLLADYNISPEVYGENKKTVATLDQFGFNYQSDELALKIGRQDITIGKTALLYSRPDSNIGKKAFVDGISFAQENESFELSGVIAREDNSDNESKNKIYAMRAGYSPSEDFSYGVTLGRYQGDASTNHWAADVTYTYGKSSLTAEFAKSNSDSDNKAYAIALNYEFDDKNDISITGFRVEEFASMGQQSDFDFDNRGIHYSLTHKLNDNANVNLVYKDQKTISEDMKNKSFEATLNYAF